jgi:isoquinoline 1-oxidoreductase subunit beta
MTYMPGFNRRSFVVGATAAGAGFALGLSLPSESDAVYAADGSSEVNAWVVIRPNETVVIRIMRSEMGQGSLTGLAQLVAEELDCDWSRVTTEFPTPGENLARNRVWGESNTTGSRAIRESNEYVRKGGATARLMLIQAAANSWNVPASDCSATNGVITHQSSGRSVSYGKVADAAAKLTPPSDVVLKSTKDWKIAGKSLKRLDTPEKLVGKTTYGNRCPVAGNALRGDLGMSGLWRNAQELRRGEGTRHAGRETCRARWQRCRRCSGGFVVASKDSARSAAGRMG